VPAPATACVRRRGRVHSDNLYLPTPTPRRESEHTPETRQAHLLLKRLSLLRLRPEELLTSSSSPAGDPGYHSLSLPSSSELPSYAGVAAPALERCRLLMIELGVDCVCPASTEDQTRTKGGSQKNKAAVSAIPLGGRAEAPGFTGAAGEQASSPRTSSDSSSSSPQSMFCMRVRRGEKPLKRLAAGAEMNGSGYPLKWVT